MAFSNDLIGSSLLPRYQQPSTQQNDKTIASYARCRLSLVALGVLMASGTALANSLPTGGTISLGEGSIDQSCGQQLNIQQNSAKLAIDWQQFNIGAGNKVTFQQPNSKAVALNRVIGSEGSKIMGQLQANGQVFLINPNGVLFGKGATVNVGGLVASTLELTNQQLDAGEYHFSSSHQSPASVINRGKITTGDQGYAVLLGGTASNQGTISAKQGTVALGAGKAATLALSDDGLIQLEISEAALNARVDNSNKLQAHGGQVLLTARAQSGVLQDVVNNQGVIEANSLQQRQGKIVLSGGEHGQVIVGGTLQATGENQGGTIVTQGAQLSVADTAVLDTRASQGNSGWWQLESEGLTVQQDKGLSGTTLSQQLSNTNIALNSGSQDLILAEQINWKSDHTLALSSDNSLQLNADISATGNNGRLELNHGEQGDYFLNNNSKVTLSGAEASFALNGQQYQVIHNVDQLQAIQNDLTGHYVLGNTIDASATRRWNNMRGFMPIGFASSETDTDNIFQGVFSGLGNTINKLAMSRSTSDYQSPITDHQSKSYGLFSHSKGQLRDVGLVDMRFFITGEVSRAQIGGLVGTNLGRVEHAYSTGRLNNSTASHSQGGLVGINKGTVSHAHSQAKVMATGKGDNVGGLVGDNYGTVDHSTAAGDVSGNNFIGGLVGYNYYATVSNSTASGKVSGNSYVGGLVGYNSDSTVKGSIATGAVTGNNFTGGLIGYNKYGWVNNSTATGRVSGVNEYSGGLIGNNYRGSVVDSTASGAVSGSNYAGGLIGKSESSAVRTSSATGDVSGKDYVGGLIGSNYRNSVSSSTASGTVSGNDNVGGLLGYNYESTVSGSSVTGAVSGNNDIGGLIGDNYAGIVSDSSAIATVSGNNRVGGLVGSNYGGSVVRYSFADGKVTGKVAGGLAGYNNATIEHSLADSNVEGNAADSVLGGLVGANHGKLLNTIASGDVDGEGIAGSLVGQNHKSGTIDYSEGEGLVNGEDGPEVGLNEGVIID